MPQSWTAQDIPDLTGKTAIVTGANSGIGYEVALELAKHHCHVVMACRDLTKGNQAKNKILAEAPGAQLVVQQLDLADFASIQAFCNAMKHELKHLSLLVNNAGVLGIPYSKTKDGFETVFQTNYLGHFMLTSLLMPLLFNAEDARIIEVSSNTHHAGEIDFDNLQGEKQYRSSKAYPNSKLAGLSFAFELHRHLRQANLSIMSVAAHPGYASTQILYHNDRGCGFQRMFFSLGNQLVAQSAAKGALPVLLACVGENVKSGDFYGPSGFKEMRGKPVRVQGSRVATDEALALKLWEKTEELLAMKFDASLIDNLDDHANIRLTSAK